MAGIKRERQLARERWERQRARRAEMETRRRQRRRRMIMGVVAALTLLVVGLAAWTFWPSGDSGLVATDPPEPAAAEPGDSPVPPAAEQPPGNPGEVPCVYNETGNASKDVGLPAVSGPVQPYTATLKLSQGTVKFSTLADKNQAPCTSRSFKHLAENNYYTGTTCHRLTTEGLFVLQCGDPSASGSGGPGYAFANENVPPDGKYPAGTVAMANSGGKQSNGSQFFLVYKDTELPPNYSVFGRITSGLDVLQKIAAKGVKDGGGDGTPAEAVRLEAVTMSAP